MKNICRADVRLLQQTPQLHHPEKSGHNLLSVEWQGSATSGQDIRNPPPTSGFPDSKKSIRSASCYSISEETTSKQTLYSILANDCYLKPPTDAIAMLARATLTARAVRSLFSHVLRIGHDFWVWAMTNWLPHYFMEKDLTCPFIRTCKMSKSCM